MLDFKITDSGDLAFSDEISSEKIRIRFSIADYPTFLLSFDTDFRKVNKKEEGLTISFDTNSTLDLNDKFSSAKNDEEIIQAIRIGVRTELGELDQRSTVGSTLLLYKHKRIDISLLNNVKNIIQDIVNSVSGNDTYSVEAVQEEGTGNFYCHNITIYIYRDNELFYSFQW